MKITLIGSHAYRSMMAKYKDQLELEGHEVKIPAFDTHPEFNELQIFEYNLGVITWAERVDIFWDQRSFGMVFDFGMTFALDKPIKVVYLESKTFKNGMGQYEWKHNEMAERRRIGELHRKSED